MISLDGLKHSWTAEVQLTNDQIITIWYTAYPMSKPSIKNVLSVSSDYPKNEISNESCRCN